jgi:hypothetical protein
MLASLVYYYYFFSFDVYIALRKGDGTRFKGWGDWGSMSHPHLGMCLTILRLLSLPNLNAPPLPFSLQPPQSIEPPTSHTYTPTPTQTQQEREALQYVFDALDGPQAQTDMDFDYLTSIADSQLGAYVKCVMMCHMYSGYYCARRHVVGSIDDRSSGSGLTLGPFITLHNTTSTATKKNNNKKPRGAWPPWMTTSKMVVAVVHQATSKTHAGYYDMS